MPTYGRPLLQISSIFLEMDEERLLYPAAYISRTLRLGVISFSSPEQAWMAMAQNNTPIMRVKQFFIQSTNIIYFC